MQSIMKTFLLICGGLVVCSSMPVAAALKTNTPSQVCAFLAALGLQTAGWKNQYGDAFGCTSPYKELGTGNPLANNLAFYADGNRSTVTQVKLVLSVNNRATASSAHSVLLKTSEALSIKATGQHLPPALKDAIQRGRKATAKVGTSTIEVAREDWPTGKGYEVQVSMQ